MQIERRALAHLEGWYTAHNRKPLVLRGARQVGKTTLIRTFAVMKKKVLIECNFERLPELLSLFKDNDPQQTLLHLAAHFKKTIVPADTILFLDEIQAAPILLSKLRWFAEEMPELGVIAAGSLLEFTLADHTFSMPVGRIQYYHLEPLSFEEFLTAKGLTTLLDYLQQYEWKNTVPTLIHQNLLDQFKEYLLVGGLPAAVATWVETNTFDKVHQVHNDLLATYKDDFSKYNGKLSREYLLEVFNAVPHNLGEKFVLSRINQDYKLPPLKKALQLLTMSKVCHRVHSATANGLPLIAEPSTSFFKMVFIDTGLVNSMLGLQLHTLKKVADLNLIHQGGLSEQVVGQLLRTINPFYVEPNLYYWVRHTKGSNAEIDYMIQHEDQIIPIEVKSGTTGTLKSLHFLMENKKLKRAVRINSDLPTITFVDTKTTQGLHAQYQLFSLPFYLIEQLHRLLQPSP